MTAPAFPTEEVTRHLVDPGMSLHEYATIAFTAAAIGRDGLNTASAPEVVRIARSYADAVIAHRAV